MCRDPSTPDRVWMRGVERRRSRRWAMRPTYHGAPHTATCSARTHDHCRPVGAMCIDVEQHRRRRGRRRHRDHHLVQLWTLVVGVWGVRSDVSFTLYQVQRHQARKRHARSDQSHSCLGASVTLAVCHTGRERIVRSLSVRPGRVGAPVGRASRTGRRRASARQACLPQPGRCRFLRS